MILVDTGYLLAVANPRDTLYERAVAWSDCLNESLLTTEFVLLEFVDAYSRVVDRRKAHDTLSWIHEGKEWHVYESSSELFDEGVALHRSRSDKDWSLTDCISFVVMQSHGVTAALTHDHHFEQAGFDALLRRDPP